MKRSILFIVNPISGTRDKGAVQKDIETLTDASQFDYRIAFTEYAGHASVLAREAVENGFDIVVAVGGDGTVNEVARSLVHTPTALGIIPCGSGNGLARHLQIPLDARKAMQIINRATISSLDYGTINAMPFFCTCGVGFDAFVSLKFATGKKRGLLSYIENTLREGLSYKPETYTIEDEEGYSVLPFMRIRSMGRGKYGNNYTVKLSQNINYEKEFGIKMYNFDILSIEGGLTKIANYVGAFASSTKASKAGR